MRKGRGVGRLRTRLWSLHADHLAGRSSQHRWKVSTKRNPIQLSPILQQGHWGPAEERDQTDTQGGRIWVLTRILLSHSQPSAFAAAPHCHLRTQSISDPLQPRSLWTGAQGWATWKPFIREWGRQWLVFTHSWKTVIIYSHAASGAANWVSHLERQLGRA